MDMSTTNATPVPDKALPLRAAIRRLGRMLVDTVCEQGGEAIFASGPVVPVLTAHPPEAREKSMIAREIEIGQLLPERDTTALTPEEQARVEEAVRRGVHTLWQTNLLRGNRLAVLDEVANGLSYYDYTFLRELPRLYGAIEDLLRADPAWRAQELPSFLSMGSWIGGDRDGNPFVTE